MVTKADTRLAPASEAEPTTTAIDETTTHSGHSNTISESTGRVRDLSPSALRRRLQIADFATLSLGVLIVGAIYEAVGSMPSGLRYQHLLIGLLSVPLWMLGLSINKLFNARAVERTEEEVRRVLAAAAFGVVTTIAAAFAFRVEPLSRGWMGLTAIVLPALLLVERQIARGIFRRMRATGVLRRRVAVIGNGADAIALSDHIDGSPGAGYRVVGVIGSAGDAQPWADQFIGGEDDTVELLRQNECVGAVISLASVDPQSVNHLTRTLADEGFHVALSSTLFDIDVNRIRPQSIDGHAMLYVEPRIRDGWRATAKRLFDLAFAGLALLLLAPVMAIVALLVKLDSRGPVLFRQVRVGLDGKRFSILKFRSMYIDAEERLAELASLNESDGPLFKIKDDPRITRVGKWIRRTSLDELPQFWNVLRGEMSIVGPRPALPREVDAWSADLHARLRVLPGITGMWQVSGRSESTFAQYQRLDLYYVDNWSLVHDLRIVAKTVVTLATQRGAS